MQLAQKHGLSKQLGKISCLEQKEKKGESNEREKKKNIWMFQKVFGCSSSFFLLYSGWNLHLPLPYGGAI